MLRPSLPKDLTLWPLPSPLNVFLVEIKIITILQCRDISMELIIDFIYFKTMIFSTWIYL
jgi:hypothetical protein